jgi:rare lipoprotein A
VAPVEIERITNEDIRTGAWRRDDGAAYAAAPAPGAFAPVALPVSTRVPPVRTAGAQQVRVPAEWVAPVAAAGTDMPPSASTMPVVPQTPMTNAAAPGDGAESAQWPPSTPPRQAIVVNDLAPLQPAPPPSPTGAPAPSNALPGFWVQLGAFREIEGAQALQGQAARGLPSLAPQLRVFSEAGTHRLQAGPFASRSAAGEAVTQVRESLRISPMVVERK